MLRDLNEITRGLTEQRETYPSMICTTPLETKISGTRTLAEFTNTVPFSTVILMLSPFIVVKVVFVRLGE